MAPDTWAMPLTMTVNSSLSVRFGEKRPDGQRRFGLAHEDAGRHIGGLGAAGSHYAQHHFRHRLDDHLHDAQVVQHGKEEAVKMMMGST